jgi:hypothetical protein
MTPSDIDAATARLVTARRKYDWLNKQQTPDTAAHYKAKIEFEKAAEARAKLRVEHTVEHIPT